MPSRLATPHPLIEEHGLKLCCGPRLDDRWCRHRRPSSSARGRGRRGVARQVCQYLHLATRSDNHRGWVLTGTIVGRGPDDEPTLSDVEPIAWLGEPLLTEA
ncbi:DUF6098 family protein [Actinopolymorpha pittospori]|uniref:DUF6098 family protein n=1 Tax=Actinopolymorpha pittospori TaxID=648752 RepID=UPI003B589D8E